MRETFEEKRERDRAVRKRQRVRESVKAKRANKKREKGSVWVLVEKERKQGQRADNE